MRSNPTTTQPKTVGKQWEIPPQTALAFRADGWEAGCSGLCVSGVESYTKRAKAARGWQICDDSSKIQNEKVDFIGFFAHFLSNHHKFAERAPDN